MSIRSWIPLGAVAGSIVTASIVTFLARPTSVTPLRNGSFGDVDGSLPTQWSVNEAVKDRGTASVEDGDGVLVLRPNSKNTDLSSAFGVVQLIPADSYRGKTGSLSVSFRAEGGAEASAMALVFDGDDKIVETAQVLASGSAMERKTTSVKVGEGAKSVMVALSVTGPRGAAYFDNVTLDLEEKAEAAPAKESAVIPEAVETFGTVWTPVVDQPLRGGPCLSWRCVGVGDPTLSRAPDGRLMLWFTTVGIRQVAQDSFVADGPLFGRAVSAAGKIKPEFGYSPESPVMSVGTVGAWDRYLETPSVRRDPKQPRWIMWYMGFKDKGGATGFQQPCLGQAFGADAEGTKWTKSVKNPIYCPSTSGWDNALVTGPTAVPPSNDAVWRVYYSGVSATNRGVGLLTSTDGLTWTQHPGNPVFKTPADAWDSVVLEQTVVFTRGKYYMFYSGYKGTLTSTTPISIGMATSTNGVTWTRQPTPVLQPGPAGSWNDHRVLAPDVVVDADGSLLLAAYGRAKADPPDSGGSIGFWRSQ